MNRIQRNIVILSMFFVNNVNYMQDMPVHDPGNKVVQSPNVVVQTASFSPSDSARFDVQAKRSSVVSLVQKGVAYMKDNAAHLDQIFHSFSDNPDFVLGELYLFVYDQKGVCFAHGQQKNLIWENLWNYHDNYGLPVVQNIVKKAEAGGGWITYTWRNATKVSYIEQVAINGKLYAIGCGYYPHAKEDSVVGLVKSASALFSQTVQQGKSAEEAFALMSYPEGQFVLGDLYLYALRFDGVVFAQADRPGLIGKNVIDAQDANGVKINQLIIQKLQEANQGVWIEYISKKAPKKAYAQKVTDAKGKHYFIACGYYPDADRQKTVDMVRLAYQSIKSNGLIATKNLINDKKEDQFRYGDLYIEVYTPDGICVAHGNNQDLVDQNFWDAVDQDGKFYVRNMINKALKESGWVDYKLRNFFKSTFVQKVSLGADTYIVCCGLYPISKRETAILMVKTAVDFLEGYSREESFREFSSVQGKFLRGDLHIFVFDFNGLCLAHGNNYDLIWKNFLDAKDDDGKAYVRLFINTSKNGPGQVSFRKNNARTIAYVEQVQKDGKSYVIGSHYYL